MRGYFTRAANTFFRVTKTIVESEINTSNTVSMISEVDLTEVEAIRARCPRDSKPSYTAFVVKAVALALQEFPYANRRLYRFAGLPFAPLRLQCFNASDIAVACERDVEDTPVATFIDVLREAELASLTGITSWLRQLAAADLHNNEQWRTYHTLIQRLPSTISGALVRLPLLLPRAWHRYRGGAALVSAPTKYGVDSLVCSWTSPIGISFGYVKERPVVREGAVVARKTTQLLLNFDRRVMAGAQAARMQARIVELLQQAERHLVTLPDDAHCLSRAASNGRRNKRVDPSHLSAPEVN